MEALETSQIPLDVRLRFSRAAVEVIARGAGVRLLHIKGDTIDASIRAQRRVGSDVDVLVHPAMAGTMHERLVEHGWSVYSTFLDGSPFGHAQTYHHPDWGFLDLHRRFPGIRIGEKTAFELLWTGHGRYDAAGVSCAVPSVDWQAVLFMLNAARGRDRRRAEARDFWQAQPDDERRRRLELVRSLRAEVAFDVTMGELERHRSSREYLLWRSISRRGDRSAEWWGRIIAARTPLEAVRTSLRAPFPNRSKLAHELGREPTLRDIAAATKRRLQTGVRELLRGRSR